MRRIQNRNIGRARPSIEAAASYRSLVAVIGAIAAAGIIALVLHSNRSATTGQRNRTRGSDTSGNGDDVSESSSPSTGPGRSSSPGNGEDHSGRGTSTAGGSSGERDPVPRKSRFVGDLETMYFHMRECEEVAKINPAAAVPMNNPWEAQKQGWLACRKCHPLKTQRRDFREEKQQQEEEEGG